MLNRKWMMGALTAVVLVGASGIAAQDGMEPIDGLNGPRGISFEEDGTLYIAEVGTGGAFETQGNFGPAVAGGTSQVTAISPDGTRKVILYGLPSRDEGGEVVGTFSAVMHDGLLWLALGQGSLTNPFSYSVVALDPETNRVAQFVDVYSAELAQNPDGDVIDSNPVDLAFDSAGLLYIADAGCNCVWRYAMGEDLELFAVWDDNPVPTSVAIGEDDTVYIGFLTGFPFAPGSSRIEHRTPDGELAATFEGLSTVVDVQYHDGTLYAVEFAVFGQGWTPDTGRVVTVSEEGVTPVAEGLNLPYGMAINGDGEMVIAVNSAYSPAGSGMVVDVMSMGAGMMEDMATEEAMMEETPEATPGA